MNYKAGDFVKCIKNCIMNSDKSIAITKGKKYKIIILDEGKWFWIIDDDGDEHKFEFDDEYFEELNKTRTKKLKKILK